MKNIINGKWVFTALAVALAAIVPVHADEELVRLGEDIAMPKSMNAKVGGEGGIPCIALQVPHSKGGYVSVSCGKSHKVADEDAVTKLQESAGRLGDKLVRFRVGDVTFYGFYCKECGGYEGDVVAMGGFQALFVFPPKGRGLDAESLEILKKVVFLPQKGFGIDSAIKLYGPKSPMKAAVKFPVLKKMVEARPECVELIALLHDVAKEAGETAAAAWCEAELKRLDPEVYGTPTTSVPTFDFTCTQGNKITESLGLYRKFTKKTVSIPTGGAAAPASVTPAPSGDGNAVATQGGAVASRPPQGNVTPNKTKTVTLPGGAKMEMVWCPAGTYMMGRRADSPCKDSNDVCPQVKVTLTKGFWLGKYEVTQAQWKSVMGANPSDPESSGDDLPVNNMSWDDAASFAKKVGGGARLPTDAEWEYACKAGTDTVFHWGDTCNGTEANCNGKKPFGTDKKGPNIDHAVKVGSYAPNAWGFHDMAGNVAEWCSDRHKDYYITHPKELTDPKGGDSSVRYRTVRGGCFYSYWRAVDCRSVKRDLCPPDVTRAYVGFRLAMDE